MKHKPSVPQPQPAPDDLPYALTFFLTARERQQVLRTLRRFGRKRAQALLRALRVER